MQPSDFTKGMAVLMAAYPDYKCTPETVDVYREFLINLDPAAFEAAIRNHIGKNKYFPKISELIEAATPNAPSPREVWATLIAHAERGEVPVLDAATERALKAAVGSWEKFGQTGYEELKFLFREFKEVYLATLDEEKKAALAITHNPTPQLGG